MPITRRQFELDIDTKTEEWMDKIKVFLAEHKSEAFTLEELRRYYFSPVLAGPLSDFGISSDEKRAFDLALEKLVEIREAEKRIIRGTEYYAYREAIPF